jgi:hypothetical protein
MNLQVVARFSATSADNHEYRPVIKPLRCPKNEELPENSQDRVGCEIFYPVSNISYQLILQQSATCVPESIQISNSPALLTAAAGPRLEL